MRLTSLLCLALATALPSPAFAKKEKNPAACKQIRAEIRYIESAARQNSTQYLTDRKRQLEEQMSRLNCSLFDK